MYLPRFATVLLSSVALGITVYVMLYYHTYSMYYEILFQVLIGLIGQYIFFYKIDNFRTAIMRALKMLISIFMNFDLN